MSAEFDLSQFLAGLAQAKTKVEAAARKALDQFGEVVIGEARKITPYLDGYLQASGTTEPVKGSGNDLTKLLGFNMYYAAAVHEILDNYHDDGQAKYLETAMKNNQSKMGPFVAGKIKDALG